MQCKLVGNFVQHLEVTLAPGEEFYAEKGVVIYLEGGIEKEVSLNGSGLRRLLGAKLSGESLFIMKLRNAVNVPRKLAIGSRFGLLPIQLDGETLICHSGGYVASDRRVEVNSKLSASGIFGGMGLFMQKISGNATVFLGTKGTPMTLDLAPGETVELDEDHIIALRSIPEHQISVRWSFKNLVGGEGLSMLQVTGPGTVYLSPGKLSEPIAE